MQKYKHQKTVQLLPCLLYTSVLLDAGHLCENLYLTCEMLGCGACAIGAYNQEAADELLMLSPGPSGEKNYECTVYAAAVGIKKAPSEQI